ncbi:GNAT family N-acetyltransferase [Streptomyces sp. NPDC050610]|uniref:GNAT family N-acetyltransferase n=1 Tax=Streptomyces sp. NPDC050610 TaxID=3157097 RepID=UPI00342A115A
MNEKTVLATFDREMRQDVRPDGPGARVERVGGVVRQVGAGEQGWSAVLWSDLTEDTADRAIAEQVEYFASLGQEFEWKHYAHDRPGDLGERLAAAGLTPEPPESLMVAEVRDLPTDVALPDGIELRAVTDEAGVKLMADVHERVFGTDATRLRNAVLTPLAEDPDTIAAIVAMDGEEPVCSARIEFNPGTQFAGLWGGGTVERWRGRGIYRALIAQRTRIAAARGYHYLQVDASDESAPILQRLGFARLSVTTPYVYQP